MKNLFLLILLLTSIFHLPTPARVHAAMVIYRTTELTSLDKDTSLVGWWTMDGKDIYGTTVLDKNPNTKNNGVKTGIQVVTGKLGQALKFNGSSDKIDSVANAQQFTDITVSFWANPNASQQSSAVIIGQQEVGWSGNGTDGGWMIMQNVGNTNQYLFEWLTANQAGTTNGLTFSLAANKWSHVTVTKSGATVTYYVNGVNVGSANGSSAALYYAVDKKINIGYWYWDNTRWWGGSLDDVRLYSRALSSTEVQNLYNQGAKKQAVAMNTSFAQATSTLNWGLIGYWSLDGSSCGASYCLDTNLNSGETKHTGTISGGVTKVAGKFSQGLAFDGSSGAVSLGSPVIPAGSWTVSAWMKTKDLTNPRYFLSQYDGTPTAGRLIIGMNRDDPARPAKLDVFQGGGAGVLTPTATLVANKWYHVTVVKDGTTLSSYVNAVLDGTAGSAVDVQVVNTNIGRAPGAGATDYWDGSVDDVRIYNRALSIDEIRQIYNLGAQKKTATVNKTPSKTTLENDGSLVAWYTMDGKDIYGNTVLDKNPSATKINGTKSGTSNVAGKLGQALNFNGTSDYVLLSNNSNLSPGTGDMTISAWVKPRVLDSTVQDIYDDYGIDTNNLVNLRIDNVTNRFKAYFRNTGSMEPTSTTGLVAGRWYHVVAVKSGTYAYIYVDGVQDGSVGPLSSGTITVNDGDAPAIGTYSHPPGTSLFKGSIDDVRVYSRALSAAEVAQLYKYGR